MDASEKILDPTEIAFERYQIIEPILTRKATLAEISRQTKRPVRTLYNWVAAFQEDGLDGLLPKVRSDKGKRRVANDELKQLIQGLFLRTPPVCIKTIFRQVLEVCERITGGNLAMMWFVRLLLRYQLHSRL